MITINNFNSKKEILNEYPELKLTEYGDFVIDPKLVEKYEIIDFHTHITEGIANTMLPPLFRNSVIDFDMSLFDKSPYHRKGKYLDFDRPSYQIWPKSLFSIFGLKVIIDMLGLTGFISSLRRASTNRLIRDMEKGSVNQAVVLPINGLDCDDTTRMLTETDKYNNFINFGSIHPYDSNQQDKIKRYIELGVKGFKLNPHIWDIEFNDPKLISLIEKLAKTNLPIISCSGLAVPDYFDLPNFIKDKLESQNLNKYEEVLTKIPNVTFVFAHGGIEQNNKVIELMNKFSNTYAEISTQPPQNIKRMIKEVGSNRLLFGSDYPVFNQSFPILAVLRATEYEDDRKAIFSKNARRILALRE
ncbi:hypothetical protein JCM16358_00200 [Halanaerocella petrolearia]